MGDIYHKPAVVTDTHCIRITGKLGLVKNKEPAKVEAELWKILPPDKSNDLCHRLVLFGREFCTARSPKCAGCPLGDICVSKSEESKQGLHGVILLLTALRQQRGFSIVP